MKFVPLSEVKVGKTYLVQGYTISGRELYGEVKVIGREIRRFKLNRLKFRWKGRVEAWSVHDYGFSTTRDSYWLLRYLV